MEVSSSLSALFLNFVSNNLHNPYPTYTRAVSVNAQVKRGQNILITGIGGGVALIAMQICLAKGAIVYVTSGNREKIQKAI